MLDRIDILSRPFGAYVATACLALSMLTVAPGAGCAQAAPPASLGVQSPAQQPVPEQAAPQQIEPTPPSAREDNPGLINEMGKLFEKSLSILPKMKSPGETANGAPDCKAGADKLCQSKGYKEGKSLDTDAAEKCSPKVFLPGRKREPGDCKTENYVIRALCQ